VKLGGWVSYWALLLVLKRTVNSRNQLYTIVPVICQVYKKTEHGNVELPSKQSSTNYCNPGIMEPPFRSSPAPFTPYNFPFYPGADDLG
jgi:hypothetical protein